MGMRGGGKEEKWDKRRDEDCDKRKDEGRDEVRVDGGMRGGREEGLGMVEYISSSSNSSSSNVGLNNVGLKCRRVPTAHQCAPL